MRKKEEKRKKVEEKWIRDGSSGMLLGRDAL